MRKNLISLICLTAISAGLLGCNNNAGSLTPDFENIAALGNKSDKEKLFVDNGIAIPETQRFLTASQENDEHPIWSPDGSMIAFQRLSLKGGYNLWLMRPDGSNQQQITNCEFDCQQPAWTPDGKSLAFRKAMGKPDANGRRDFDISRIDIKTGKEVPVVTYPGDDKHPNYSHDGKYIVFNSERDGNKANLYIVPANNPAAKPLRITNSTDTNDVHPNFSKDGKLILFHSYILNLPTPPTPEDAPSKLGIISSNGTNLRWLPVGNLLYPKHPFFTPDENIITFHATDPDTLKRNIYAININKPGKPVQITEIKNAKHPEISPDGRFLAYSHKRSLNESDEKQYDISVVEINYNKLRSYL
jgi:Tol biopolymer transport system component